MPGTYVSIKPTETYAKLIADKFWYLPKTKACRWRDYHVTLMYSKTEIPEAENFQDEGLLFDADIVQLDWFLGHDRAGYLIAVVDSKEIRARHNFWKSLGGKHSFPEYKPHLTLAVGITRAEWNKSLLRVDIDPFPILLHEEKVERLNEDWRAK